MKEERRKPERVLNRGGGRNNKGENINNIKNVENIETYYFMRLLKYK